MNERPDQSPLTSARSERVKKVAALAGRSARRKQGRFRIEGPQSARSLLAHRPELSYPKVSATTLVVRGGSDPVSPIEWCREVVDAIPDAREFEVARHGHETLIRDAGPAAAEILAFVSAAPDRP